MERNTRIRVMEDGRTHLYLEVPGHLDENVLALIVGVSVSFARLQMVKEYLLQSLVVFFSE